MGGRKFQCEDCNESTYLYNSCVDRNCPQCSGARRVDFHRNAAKRVIDGVVYYQVTMTLPSELSGLALFNRELFAELLPKSAWSATDRCTRSEQGYRSGAISVLHTWNQKLENHWHVHLLVPGAGPSIDGQRWVQAKPPPEHDNTDGFYLVDADRLREKFRSGFLRRLDRARTAGRLKLTGRFAYLADDDNWTVFQKQLASLQWVAHIQPPPTPDSLAHHVVNYLTRYVTGGPISDRRIVSANPQRVTFMAREGNRVGGERQQVAITLSTSEFTQRWSQHIQPAGLTKVRYFGGLSNTKVAAYQTQCEELFPSVDETLFTTTHEPTDDINEPDLICAHCGSERMQLVDRTSKPSWQDLLGYHSESAPWWYVEARNESDREFWDGVMGEGFNEWYLGTLVESAKAPEPSESPPKQLMLPGLESVCIASSYQLNSF